jgi:competence protein ComEC
VGVVSPYLWSRAISRLDTAAITHARADHMGGAGTILANFRPQELWLADPTDPEMKTLVQHAQDFGTRVVRHQAAMSSTLAGPRSASWPQAQRTLLRGAMMNLW